MKRWLVQRLLGISSTCTESDGADDSDDTDERHVINGLQSRVTFISATYTGEKDDFIYKRRGVQGPGYHSMMHVPAAHTVHELPSATSSDMSSEHADRLGENMRACASCSESVSSCSAAIMTNELGECIEHCLLLFHAGRAEFAATSGSDRLSTILHRLVNLPVIIVPRITAQLQQPWNSRTSYQLMRLPSSPVPETSSEPCYVTCSEPASEDLGE